MQSSEATNNRSILLSRRSWFLYKTKAADTKTFRLFNFITEETC